MPNIRIFTTDSNGNNTLLRTVVCDSKLNTVEVVDHVPKDQLAEQSKRIIERARSAFEDLARQDPAGLLKALEEQDA